MSAGGEAVRVSVIIPVYNGADTIGRAIQSVFAQDYRSYELIVVDDGSTDSTADVVRGFGSRVRYARQENRGPAAARNAGAKLAGGEYLAFLDADDQWMPYALGRLSRALDANVRASLAYCDFIVVDEVGREQISTAGEAPSMGDLLARGWPIMSSAVAIRRCVFEQCGGMCERFQAPGFEDTYLWYRARELGEFVHICEPLMRYQNHDFAERAYKYDSGRRLFEDLMTERYGPKASRVIQDVRRNFAFGAVQHAVRLIDSGDFRSGAIALSEAIKTCPGLLFNPGVLRRVFHGRNFARLARLLFRSTTGPTAVPRQ